MDRSSSTEACADWAETLVQARRTVLPRHLAAPGPDARQLRRILSAAAAAPDHGGIVPWRFVVIPDDAREALAQAFHDALRARDASATPQQLACAREKAFRGPVLVLAIVDGGEAGSEVPAPERIVSAGCAIQNVLLVATAMGLGSALTSGQALTSDALRDLFSLSPSEQALCFLSFGTAVTVKPRCRPRPGVDAYVTTLDAGRPLRAPAAKLDSST